MTYLATSLKLAKFSVTEHKASEWVSLWLIEVLSGVPQGSVLGPLLFLLYVNDLPNWVKANIKIFADDTKLWGPICSVEDSDVLQEDLRRLKVWSDEWLLHFNPEKNVK